MGGVNWQYVFTIILPIVFIVLFTITFILMLIYDFCHMIVFLIRQWYRERKFHN